MKKKLILILLVFIYNISSAQLKLIHNYLEGEGGIEGLKYPNDLETDNTGNIYIIGNSSYLHLFMPESAENPAFVELKNVSDIPGLANDDEIKATPDQHWFYIVADNKLLLFSKKLQSGQLDYVKTFENNIDFELGYGVFTDLAISPDGKNLYLTREDDTDQHALKVFAIDSESGNLTLKNKIDGIKNINDIVCNNQFIYTTSRGNNENSVCVFKRTENDNLLLVQKINAADTISQIKSLALSTDGKFLYFSDNNSVFTFKANQTTGELKYSDKITISDYYEHFWNETTLTASSDNQNLYLTDFLGIMVFKRDVESGKITFIQKIQEDYNFTGFYSISTLKISESGSKVYVLSKYNDSFIIFDRNNTDGTLTYSNKIANEQNKIKGLTDIRGVIIPKNGKFLYTITESGYNTIGFYKRLQDGRLDFQKNILWNELGPEIGAVKDIQLSPDERSVYISSTNMYGIRVLTRDTVSGNLSFFNSYTAPVQMQDEIISEIVIPADGKNLYAATYNYIVNYAVDSISHDLIFNSKILTEGPDNGGLAGYKKIIASNDSKNLYVFSSSSSSVNGISVYKRDENGNPELVETLLNTEYPFMVDVNFSIAISPDDQYLYVAGTSLLCFKRNPENGKLTFEFEIKYDKLNIGYLYRLASISISRDGKYFLAVSNEKKIALSFYRSASTGKLKLKQVAHFSTDDNYSSADPFSVFSDDMKTTYIASPYDGSLGAYETGILLGLDSISDFCKGDNALIQVDEGYNYLWSNGSTRSFTTTTKPGIYTVQVSDGNGRTGVDTTTVVFHNQPSFSLALEDWASTDSTLMINSFITDGEFPYTYLWNDGSTLQFINASKPDSLNPKKDFSLTITDKYGCFSSKTISLIYTNSKDFTLTDDKRISIYPNPFDKYLNINLEQDLRGYILVKISNSEGKTVLEKLLDGEKLYKLDVGFLKPGMYVIEVTDNKNTQTNKILKLKSD